MTQEKNLTEIFPFGQTERVGNFKLWRGKYKVKTTDGTTEVDCVHISDLSGSWAVRIPATYEMYGILTGTFMDYKSDDDALKRRAFGVLQTVLANMMYVSVIGNGYFQRGVEMLATVYANPSVLSKKDDVHKDFLKDVKATVKEFLEWRKGFDEERKKYEPTEGELHQDELADQAAEMLN